MADRYDLTNYSGEQVKTAIGRGLTSLQPTAQTLSDIQKQTVRTNIGAMGALNVYNPNLLINGDFAINQRGASSYVYTSAKIYGVDRWYLTVANVTAGVSGTTLTLTSTNTSAGVMQSQDLENFAKYKSKTVTVSFNATLSAGSFAIQVSDGVDTTISSYVSATGTVTATHTVNASATKLTVSIMQGAVATTITPIYCKLELGNIATPFVPPLIAEELPKCQRYYWKLNSASAFANIANGFFRDTTNYRALFYLPTVMRTSPTATINGTLSLLNSSLISTSGYTSLSFQGNICVLQITASSAQTAGSYAVVSLDSGSVEFDAEIY